MWESIKESARFIWARIKYPLGAAVVLLIEDHLDGLHTAQAVQYVAAGKCDSVLAAIMAALSGGC